MLNLNNRLSDSRSNVSARRVSYVRAGESSWHSDRTVAKYGNDYSNSLNIVGTAFSTDDICYKTANLSVEDKD